MAHFINPIVFTNELLSPFSWPCGPLLNRFKSFPADSLSGRRARVRYCNPSVTGPAEMSAAFLCAEAGISPAVISKVRRGAVVLLHRRTTTASYWYQSPMVLWCRQDGIEQCEAARIRQRFGLSNAVEYLEWAKSCCTSSKPSSTNLSVCRNGRISLPRLNAYHPRRGRQRADIEGT